MPTFSRTPKHDEWVYALDALEATARPAPVGPLHARPILRGWLMLCDALLVASAPPSARTALDHLRVLLSPRSRHFGRPAAALKLLDWLLPGSARTWQTLTVRGDQLPLDRGALRVLDYGTGDTVYVLETDRGRVVCKIQRASLGRPLPELVALAAHRRRGYEAVLRHYAGMEEVFPWTRFLVVQGPLFGVPAVLSLQEYVDGQKLDLLHELEDESISRLLEAHPPLRDQIHRFLERTLQAWEGGQWIVDFGKGNLLVVDDARGPRLVYLDVQMKQVRRLRARSGARLEPQIDRMRAVVQLAVSAGRTDSSVGTIRSTRNEGSR